ncbi:MAG: hypothetical protein OHK93_006001 [Ramalina farinacea]|uniref:Amidase domain-containing protein n=1 Tax=Ramalina farinacea TaxID=258253 RepID=A0AA43QLY8_9LECA|nr:hypothetical protein [Ramalina farinacea]
MAVVGPLSTSIEGVKIFMKTVIDSKPWIEDPTLVPLPWRTGEFSQRVNGSRRLKIGVMESDGIVTPHPPIQRAMRAIVSQLKKIEDIEILDWKPYRHDLASELISSLYYPDAGKETAEIINSSGEPWRPLSKLFLPTENKYIKERTPGEMYELRDRMEKYKLEYAEKWNSTASHRTSDGHSEGAVDVILCPVGPGVAPPLDCSRYWGYTSQWNLLDYPALVFPVSKADPDVDAQERDYVPTNEHDNDNYNLYEDPEQFRGAPVSLQLVGRRYEDEKVIEIMEYLQDRLELPFASST